MYGNFAIICILILLYTHDVTGNVLLARKINKIDFKIITILQFLTFYILYNNVYFSCRNLVIRFCEDLIVQTIVSPSSPFLMAIKRLSLHVRQTIRIKCYNRMYNSHSLRVCPYVCVHDEGF